MIPLIRLPGDGYGQWIAVDISEMQASLMFTCILYVHDIIYAIMPSSSYSIQSILIALKPFR